MALRIEDYALIGDGHTAALVGFDGSIDWLCFPRFDSASTFGALLGNEEHGHWTLRPVGVARATSRRYLDDTFVLVTRWTSEVGEVEVTDFMPIRDRRADIVRRITGIRGTVAMEQVLRIRFDYADSIPWVRQVPDHDRPGPHGHALIAVAGPDAVVIRGPRLTPQGLAHLGEFEVHEGEVIDIGFTWYPSHREPPPAIDVEEGLTRTIELSRRWASHFEELGEYDHVVRRSLLVLRALTHEDTGGIVAAATTSLPEALGGVRNWDYRFVWLRDAALTLQALMVHGLRNEALGWRDWLLRAIAGDPADVQIMYGIGGERRLTEWVVPQLPGYDGAAPVRVGNAAYLQFQGDVFGEIMLALERARQLGVDEDQFSWALQVALLDYIEKNLDRPDHGIWEMRGPQQFFTHSRAMVWASFACGVRAVEEHGLEGPVERWRQLRDQLRAEIDERGYDTKLGSFVQHYGGTELDASLLLLPEIGFIAHDDPRMLSTSARIEAELLDQGLLRRYRATAPTTPDQIPGDENAFLACTFWLVQHYAMSGRVDQATALMDRMVGLANDVGLLSEEYDVRADRMTGNFPQAFSHLALVQAADAISRAQGKSPRSGPVLNPVPEERRRRVSKDGRAG
jgi:GH15 family glucan-1,4-alpha-glucosidase